MSDVFARVMCNYSQYTLPRALLRYLNCAIISMQIIKKYRRQILKVKLKGAVSRAFLLLVFFLNQFPPWKGLSRAITQRVMFDFWSRFPSSIKKEISWSGTVYKKWAVPWDESFLGGPKNKINTFCMSADGFNNISLGTFLRRKLTMEFLLASIKLLLVIVKILPETFFRKLVQAFRSPPVSLKNCRRTACDFWNFSQSGLWKNSTNDSEGMSEHKFWCSFWEQSQL